jgi:predicted dehydrogenase
LCEKPLACNAVEAQEMANASEDAGRLLMEALMYRFHPRTQRIKELVSAGSIGEPCLLRSAFCYHIGDDLLESTACARLKPEMGGGSLLDVGCYSVSVSRWLLGAEPTLIQGQALYHSCGVDVHYVGSMRFQDNALATIEASFISALQQTYTVVGNRGAIELPHDAFIPWEKDAVFTLRNKDEEEGRKHITGGADEYQLMVEHFADAVAGEIPLAVTPEESVQNMRVLDALAESARSGVPTKMSYPA